VDRLSVVVGAAALTWLALASFPSIAGPRELVAGYEAAARQATPMFAGFSAARGAKFFQETHGGEWSCSTCHTGTPTTTGRHARTGKNIAPLAPAVNPERFTDAATAEKWFRRNCNDVVGRECTPQEKGDVLTWLISLK
jgi:cytochrome c peroxidase